MIEFSSFPNESCDVESCDVNSHRLETRVPLEQDGAACIQTEADPLRVVSFYHQNRNLSCLKKNKQKRGERRKEEGKN